MGKTIILVHGRAPKPRKEDLESLWLAALKYGLERDHRDKLAAFQQVKTEFVYYGDISNAFLDPDYDVDADARSRWVTLDALKACSRNDFFQEDNYNSLPGKASWMESLADVFAGFGARIGLSDPLIRRVLPDMRDYWNPDSEYGTDVRFPMIQPMRDAMDRNDTIMVIAHSLGTMIAYDTFWKFCHTGEYRPNYTEKKIDLFVSLGSPLGDETVKNNLKGSQASGLRRYPNNILRWVNIAAEDDYISHNEQIADDYRDMLPDLVGSLTDHRIYNLAVRHGKSNPHHGAGYLIHPVLADVVAQWL